MEEQKSLQRQRLVYADLLRVAALLAVIVLHVCGNNWQGEEITSLNWKILNVFDSLVRWCVPVFVMLSGMFFLDPKRPVTYRSIFGKNLLRVGTAFIVWSVFYALFTALLAWRGGTPQTPMQTWLDVVYGHYHLWFPYMIMGLYLVTPILRRFVESASRRDLEYYLALYFIFTLLMPAFHGVPGLQVIGNVSYRMDVKSLAGYVGYFVAGYYLKTFDFKPRTKRVIYLLGVLGAVCTIVFTWLGSVAWEAPNEKWYQYFTPNVSLMAFAIFLFFKEKVTGARLKPRTLGFVTRVSQFSFGIYLVHAFFNNRLVSLGLDAVAFTPLVAVPLATVLVFAMSYATIWLLSKIPLFRKYCM